MADGFTRIGRPDASALLAGARRGAWIVVGGGWSSTKVLHVCVSRRCSRNNGPVLVLQGAARCVPSRRPSSRALASSLPVHFVGTLTALKAVCNETNLPDRGVSRTLCVVGGLHGPDRCGGRGRHPGGRQDGHQWPLVGQRPVQ